MDLVHCKPHAADAADELQQAESYDAAGDPLAALAERIPTLAALPHSDLPLVTVTSRKYFGGCGSSTSWRIHLRARNDDP